MNENVLFTFPWGIIIGVGGVLKKMCMCVKR
jgi:hypothetical protein